MASVKPSAEVVTEQRRIAQLLNLLIESRALLTVFVHANRRTYTSSMIETNTDHRMIMLDEFIPAISPHEFQKDVGMSIQSKAHGIPINFITQFEHVGSKDGFDFLIASLPNKITYEQKRRHFRLVTRGANAPAMLFQIEDQNIESTMLNISAGGAKIKLKTDIEVEEGDVIEDGRISFEDGTGYDTSFEICMFNQEARIMGIKFLSLTAMEARDLQSWITNTERMNLRKRIQISERSTAMT